MPKKISITLNTARLDQLNSQLEPRAHAILDKAAFDILAFAQPLTNYDTGALRNSGYVSGASGGSTYGAGASEAQARRPGVNIAPEESPRSRFSRIVGFSVEYAYWQEFAKPFLVPAVEHERPLLTEAWKQLFEL
jgi:hypothetical protein